jgi:hypothetical protein
LSLALEEKYPVQYASGPSLYGNISSYLVGHFILYEDKASTYSLGVEYLKNT